MQGLLQRVHCRNSKTFTRGFTLTELAIVLGIVGIIIGAIWSATSYVQQNNKARVAVQEAALILQGYRNLYSTHGIDVADGTDVTCTGIKNGYFPSNMLQAGTSCASGNPLNPWFTTVQIFANNTLQGISIQFNNLTPDQCFSFANQVNNVADVIQTTINATTKTSAAPFIASTIRTACAVNAGAANTVSVVFKAR